MALWIAYSAVSKHSSLQHYSVPPSCPSEIHHILYGCLHLVPRISLQGNQQHLLGPVGTKNLLCLYTSMVTATLVASSDLGRSSGKGKLEKKSFSTPGT